MYTPSFFIGISNALDTANFYTNDVKNEYFKNQLPLLTKCKQLQVKQLSRDGAREKTNNNSIWAKVFLPSFNPKCNRNVKFRIFFCLITAEHYTLRTTVFGANVKLIGFNLLPRRSVTFCGIAL